MTDDREFIDDQQLFRNAVRGVTTLKQTRAALRGRRPKPIPAQTKKNERQVVKQLLNDDLKISDYETGDELLYCRPGLSRAIFRKLRKGDILPEAELDLHGKIVSEAKESVGVFLKQCYSSQRRCIRIIHGKGLRSPGGQPILKIKIDIWLRQRDEVLAYCSAQPRDGGTGAVYVLLKKQR